MVEELITGRADLWLGVEKRSTNDGIEVTLRLKGNAHYVLHWGFARRRPGTWQAPPATVWPSGTRAFSKEAAQTPFSAHQGEREIVIRLGEKLETSFLVFDLFCPDTRRWENNQGKDYYVALPELGNNAPPLEAVLDGEIQGSEVLDRKILVLDAGEELAIAVTRRGEQYQILLLSDAASPVVLHWGVPERARSQWQPPRFEWRPPGTVVVDNQAVQTPFEEWQHLRRLKLEFQNSNAPAAISFLLHQTGTGQWLKFRGQNLYVPVAPRSGSPDGLSAWAEQIVEAEMGQHGWTLMHRFNLCYDLIDEVRGQREGWATLFVWLRYSAIRQLDWQRNFNTKPRELTHAQERLALKLAAAFPRQPQSRDLIRLILTCVGRGGEGQRIRDEILQIMHRHHIKEVAGRFLEEWHQKLHNNATPDDIVICEAYLAFLRSNGDVNQFYETLLAGGVTRERLASFERPILAAPDFVPHLKDGLLHDFENYLRLLRSVHSATDLETAAAGGAPWLDGPGRNTLGFVRQRFRDASVSATELANKITEVRQHLYSRFNDAASDRARDLLYLDLALEEALRIAIERAIHSGFSGEQLLQLITFVLDNLLLLPHGAELEQCRREWQRLPPPDRFSPDWALHAKAALDRLRRAIEAGIDQTYQLLQPTAESLGQAFHADAWAVKLFSEEVARGQLVFVLSMLIHHLDPILRKQARLGDWQVISPSIATGEVQLVESLRTIQGRKFERPTVIVAEKVYGDEEPPEGVRAVITPSSVDLVSHVAVRARNASLLFATCYDRGCFERLQAMKGRVVELKVSPAGDVLFAEAAEPMQLPKSAVPAPPPVTRSPGRTPVSQAVGSRDFAMQIVGGKSWHLKTLAEKLPDWIRTPRSVALPFGVFEGVLELEANRSVAARFRERLGQINEKPESTLAEIRNCLLELQLPDSLRDELRRAMDAEGLPWPEDWPAAAERIKQVWASKWNDRAHFSRQARGWPHEAVCMAVLIQEVIEAEYAFVIHTVNPFNNSQDELYAEVVLGLGETLVGNYPGRALSFTYSKADGQPTVLAYPSKSIGLYGGGLIFRSDSNAEDLAGYAGAGLYDSVLLEPPREAALDYTSDPLVWDSVARSKLLGEIARLGNTVETVFGAPQDIEGAFAKGRFYVVQSRPQVGLHNEKIRLD
jgi:alpha-glucan,water dikinase